jgi:hypothetical protein
MFPIEAGCAFVFLSSALFLLPMSLMESYFLLVSLEMKLGFGYTISSA